MKTSTLHDAISIALLAIIAGMAGPALAAESAAGASAPERPVEAGSLAETDFDLPAGPLASSLDAFERQSGIEVRYQVAQVTGKQAREVSGRMAWPDALSRVLQGTGLGYRQVDGRTVVIERRSPRAAQAATEAATQSATAATQSATDLATVTVTGTRIRGGTSPSPVITIGSEDIREQGFADLGQVIRAVPQNFNGGQNPGVTLGSGGLANQNLTGGSSLNLRGLGSDATLTLLNGRRMAYGGFVRAVDIGAIPVEAVDRVEIVADGASAIYGSDAVGGVGNVILKRDYEGVRIGARYGNTSNGGLATREYTATAGAVWSGGGLIAAYQDSSVDPIHAAERRYTDHLAPPTTIYPGSDLRSALLSAHQALGGAVELRVDALRTKRGQRYNRYTGPVDYYSHFTPETTATLVSPTIEIYLSNDWRLSAGGAWGRNEHIQYESRVFKDAEPVPRTNDCYCNDTRTYEIGAEGPLFALRGGDARLAIGAGYRTNEFLHADRLADAAVTEGDEGSRFAYAEVSLPLLGPAANVAGARRLEVTAAIRGEDYDSFGSVTTPKLGLIYGPNADFTLKTSWGRSFKAPTLFQRYWDRQAVLYPAAWLGGADYPSGSTALLWGGGNPDLEPERARTWTTALVFHPEALRNLEMELAWFDIDYTGRVVQPITNYAQALSDPVYGQFVTRDPTLQQQQDAIAAADTFNNFSGAPYDPGNVAALIYGPYVNVARQQIRGVDLSGSYRFDLGGGQLTIRGSGSWLDSSQQDTAAQSAHALSGTLYNPARINSRIGGVWTRDGFSAAAFANYTSGVTNTVDDEKTASFTTVDATLRYSTEDFGSAWSGLEFALSVQNLFDRPPPLHETLSDLYAPYDSTNYSAIGRFLSVSVSKRFGGGL